MDSLLTWITERITPDTVTGVASRLGETDASVSRGLTAAVTSVLAGIAAKAGDASTIRDVYDLATNGDNDVAAVTDVRSAMDRALVTGSPTAALGGRLLSSVLGANTNDVTGAISRSAGFTKPSSGASILSLAAPIVLGFLGKRIRDKSLGIAGFTSLLAGQRDTILAAAPPGVRALVEPSVVGSQARSESRRDTPIVPPPSRGNRWLLPVAGGLAALALVWALSRRTGTPDVATVSDSVASVSAVVDSATAAGRRTVDSAAGAVGNLTRDLGAFVSRALPGGPTLNIPERGIESHLIAFIEDASRPVNDTTWFDFDRLNFATGSATILPQSQEQLDNIAAVLKAYPQVNVKVGGYTDNTGDAAANLKLSQARAESVRQALTEKGIAASRLAAEGYGDKHPVDDNSTEEGRARNRRIALRVTAK
jgi:OOP family OmpA-OmpF porin